jgi:hypothetical protein
MATSRRSSKSLLSPVNIAEQLNEFVRAKFVEKWHEVQVARDQQP